MIKIRGYRYCFDVMYDEMNMAINGAKGWEDICDLEIYYDGIESKVNMATPFLPDMLQRGVLDVLDSIFRPEVE